MLFHDRAHAGRLLAQRLADYGGRSDVVVLGLPRGGVPVAFEVAAALGAPLDVFVVRKLGLPGQPELAMGAIATGGVLVLNDEIVGMLGIDSRTIDEVARVEEVELARRERAYRGDRPAIDVKGKVVIVVDDGLATGATMRAAVRALKLLAPARVVAAAPVAEADTCRALLSEADDVICAVTPPTFRAVGMWYHDFSQTTDAEVQALLERGEPRAPAH
jgi:putative phosphoribosyl transferase